MSYVFSFYHTKAERPENIREVKISPVSYYMLNTIDTPTPDIARSKIILKKCVANTSLTRLTPALSRLFMMSFFYHTLHGLLAAHKSTSIRMESLFNCVLFYTIHN